jgi:hypothetical protein
MEDLAGTYFVQDKSDQEDLSRLFCGTNSGRR